MSFTATSVPGPKAVAAVQILGRIHHQPAMMIYLDPDRVVICPPHSPVNWPGFLRFLRDLRDLREAVDDLADHLDPRNESD